MTDVLHRAAAWLVSDDNTTPLLVDLMYSPKDPFAVEMAFFPSEDAEPVKWTFARELLSSGTSREAGELDVVVWPTEESDEARSKSVYVMLSSPEGRATIGFAREDVTKFLHETYTEVPPGTERVDVDSWIQEILAET